MKNIMLYLSLATVLITATEIKAQSDSTTDSLSLQTTSGNSGNNLSQRSVDKIDEDIIVREASLFSKKIALLRKIIPLLPTEGGEIPILSKSYESKNKKINTPSGFYTNFMPIFLDIVQEKPLDNTKSHIHPAKVAIRKWLQNIISGVDIKFQFNMSGLYRKPVTISDLNTIVGHYISNVVMLAADNKIDLSPILEGEGVIFAAS